jgi:hypothetical protein
MAAASLRVVVVLSAPMPAQSQLAHRGNYHSAEARSCAEYVETKYNRTARDRADWRRDSERLVEITFYSVAQVPHLFRGNKFVSMGVYEYYYRGNALVGSRMIRDASYCVLDRFNRVVGLEQETR